VREDDQSSRPPWEAQNSFEPARLDQNVDRFRIFSHGTPSIGALVGITFKAEPIARLGREPIRPFTGGE
jgi:hypothetical protein